MKINPGFRLALAAGAAFGALAGNVSAETAAGDELSEIIVVGQRQAYRGDVAIKDTPQSIQVLDAQLLNTIGATGLEDALEMASGISKQNNFGGLWDAFAVRGFSGDENYPSGYLVNGFNGGRGYGGPRDASNIERIEVLKGPNSALFGRGEPGGTVNIITKKPKFETEGSFSLSAGSYDNYRVEGDVTGAVTDKIAVRLNGAAEDAGSFRDTIKTKKYTASPSILLELTEDTSLSYEMEYVNQKVPFDRGVVAVNGELGLISDSTFLGDPADGPMKVRVLGHQAQVQHDISDNWSVLVGAGYRETSFKGYSTEAELASGRQTLDKTNGVYLSRQRRYRDFQTEHSVLRAETSGTVETGDFTHHLIIGTDWDKFEVDHLQLRARPSSYTAGNPITAANNAVNIYDPVYGNLLTPSAFRSEYETQEAWGIYLQDQIDVTEKLKIRFGGRYDDFDHSIDFRRTNTNASKTYKKFSPQAGVTYEFTEEVSVYGSYGKGFRPNSGADASNNLFRPEETKSYEVGTKYTTPDGRITSTVALFTMKKNNVLTADPVNSGYSLAIGKARSKGIEFDLNAKLPEDIQVYLTYAYTDAEVAEDMLDPNFSQPILKGAALLNVPKNSANLLITKEFTVGTDDIVTVGGGVNYVDKRLGETATEFYLPSYTLVKLLASWQPTDQLKLSVDVNNLFDKRYYASSYARLWVAPGTPRTFTAKVSYTF
jgi:iron complex outermembrane receptor protein